MSQKFIYTLVVFAITLQVKAFPTYKGQLINKTQIPNTSIKLKLVEHTRCSHMDITPCRNTYAEKTFPIAADGTFQTTKFTSGYSWIAKTREIFLVLTENNNTKLLAFRFLEPTDLTKFSKLYLQSVAMPDFNVVMKDGSSSQDFINKLPNSELVLGIRARFYFYQPAEVIHSHSCFQYLEPGKIPQIKNRSLLCASPVDLSQQEIRFSIYDNGQTFLGGHINQEVESTADDFKKQPIDLVTEP